MRTHSIVWVLVVLGAAALAGTGAAVAAPVTPPPEVLTVVPDRGPVEGGQVVSVTGTGFVQGETYVQFGGLVLDTDVVSATRLTFLAPPHPAGRVSLAVIVVELSSEGSIDYLIESPPPSSSSTSTGTSAPAVTPTPSPTGVATQDVSRSDGPPPGRRDRPVVTREQSPPAPPTLAATGARTGVLALTGVLTVLAGAVLVALGRPRRAAGVSS